MGINRYNDSRSSRGQAQDGCGGRSSARTPLMHTGTWWHSSCVHSSSRRPAATRSLSADEVARSGGAERTNAVMPDPSASAGMRPGSSSTDVTAAHRVRTVAATAAASSDLGIRRGPVITAASGSPRNR